MSGPRIGVALPGGDAAAIVALAEQAEAANVDVVVIGDPGGRAANADDAYVLATAGAVAVRTRDVRVALALGLRGSSPLVRVVEDVGVVDVMTNGRTELLMRPGGDDDWRADLEAMLDGWRAWPMPDGRTVPLTPCPVQPAIPTWTFDGPRGTGLRGQPGVLLVAWPATLPDADALREIRRRRDAVGASTVIFDVAGVAPDQRARAVRAIGGVAGPGLRCPEDEVGILTLDSTEYLVERPDLHRPPLPG